MQKTIDELQKQLDEASSGAKSTSQDTYKIEESYVVEGQWKITVDSVEVTDDRNEYSDKNPAAVYLVTYTYENLGYDDDIMNGLYISLDDGIVDMPLPGFIRNSNRVNAFSCIQAKPVK